MIIQVKIFSTLKHHVPHSDKRLDEDKWEVTEGATVSQVLDMLSLPEEEAKIFLVNGRNADRDRALTEGDVLHVFPLMAGG
jgi:molybdopterin converting factor small subunit